VLRTTLAPLRTTVGRALPIFGATVAARSPDSDVVDVNIRSRMTLNEIVYDPIYGDLIPQAVYLGTQLAPYAPAPGVATMPVPVDLPFDADVPFVSLFGIGNVAVHDDVSRKLWVDIDFDLGKDFDETIGGICFGGYPYVPGYVDASGESSANFGLPRELRLSWSSYAAQGFVDADDGLTSQEPVSHSGVHILATGPVRAGRLRLRLSDFPRLLISVRPQVTGNVAVTEAWGFAIPYLYLFAYEESTRYRPHVPAGLLAAVETPPSHKLSYFDPLPDPGGSHYAGTSPDVVLRAAPGLYAVFSAASLFGQRRSLQIAGETVDEFFTSTRLQSGAQLRLTIEQSEEEPRCVAAIRLSYPDVLFMKNAPPLDLSTLDVEIYELDPTEGVSPVDPHRDLASDRYTLRLFSKKAVRPSPDGFVCRLLRPSCSRRFAVVFTCPQNDKGRRVALTAIELLQSSHVDVAQRPSRTQTVRALHFRIYGEELAADYARLGDDGFTLSVEHVVAGDRRETLFEARTLLDLLQLPSARLTANRRFEETVHEEVEEEVITHAGGHDDHRTRTSSDGWARSETGTRPDGLAVTWPGAALDGPPPGNGFTSFSSAESRAQTRQLPPSAAAIDVALSNAVDTIATKLGVTLPAFTSTTNDLIADSTADGLSWQTVIWPAVLSPADASVTGLTIYALPPIVGSLISAIDAATAVLTAAPSGDFDLSAVEQFRDALIGLFAGAGPLAWISGVGISVNSGANLSESAGIGVTVSGGGNYGGSISVNTQVPTVTHNVTVGRTGTIVKQAQATGYSYSQLLTKRLDAASLRVDYDGGLLKRRTKRDVDVDARTTRRSNGAEVYWQGGRMDVVTGTIPLDVTLPGTAGQLYRTTDEAVRVRFANGIGESLRVDLRFDVVEDLIRDDY
jgi:hypothetical protein